MSGLVFFLVYQCQVLLFQVTPQWMAYEIVDLADLVLIIMFLEAPKYQHAT